MSTPVFDSGVGKGASYAATTSSGSSVVHVMRISCPGWNSVPVRRTRSRNRSHVSDGGRPEKMPVLSTTSRAIRSGRSTARRIPSGPPQSCITTVDVTQVELVDEALERRRVRVVRVPVALDGLVAAAEAEVVRRDAARDGRDLRDHLAVEVRPRRLAVEQEDRRALALVDVVHPHPVLLDVVRRELVAGQRVEALVRRAVDIPRRPVRHMSGGSHS